jgi:hypothetical protein
MATSSFLQVLTSEVARMQTAHPEREGELARAHALITLGMVTPSPDDPQTGQVLSSDLNTVYHVNGVCDCDAGQHGRGCKHVHGWRLYQYVQKKLDAQTQEPQDITAGSNISPAGQPLPEAPASVNCHLTIAGRQVQLTLRDTDEARVLARLQAVLARYPVEAQPQAASSPQGTGYCQRHGVHMQWNTGKSGGGGWWSHKTADGWCKGKGR